MLKRRARALVGGQRPNGGVSARCGEWAWRPGFCVQHAQSQPLSTLDRKTYLHLLQSAQQVSPDLQIACHLADFCLPEQKAKTMLRHFKEHIVGFTRAVVEAHPELTHHALPDPSYVATLLNKGKQP